MTQQALEAFAMLTAAVQAQQAVIAERDRQAQIVAGAQARLDTALAQAETIRQEKQTAADALQVAQVGITSAVTRTYTASQTWVRVFTTQPDPSI